MWYNGELQEVMASDTWRKFTKNPGFHNLARVASLCNRAEWEPLPKDMPVPPLSKRKILGDASDAALLKCMEVLVKGGAEAYRRTCTKVLKYSCLQIRSFVNVTIVVSLSISFFFFF